MIYMIRQKPSFRTMGSTARRCDICLGVEGNIVSSPLLSQLLRKHLGVIVCDVVKWCDACSHLLRLWDDFSLRARQNLSLSNHTLIAQSCAFQDSTPQVVTLDLDSDSDDEVMVCESAVNIDTTRESSVTNASTHKSSVNKDSTLASKVMSQEVEIELGSEETSLLDPLEVEKCHDDVENLSDNTENVSDDIENELGSGETLLLEVESCPDNIEGCPDDVGNKVNSEEPLLLETDKDSVESSTDTVESHPVNVESCFKDAEGDQTVGATETFSSTELQYIGTSVPLSPLHTLFARTQPVVVWSMPSPETVPDDPMSDPLSFEPFTVKTEPLDLPHMYNECSICSRKFSIPGALRLHSKFKHGIILDENLHPSSQEPPTPSTLYKCNVCLRRFPSKRALEYHFQSTHEKSVKVKIASTITKGVNLSKYVCKFCNRNMRSREILLLHIDNAHERQDECDDSSKWSIECPYCDKKHFSRRSLDSHMAHTHAQKQPASATFANYEKGTSVSSKTRTFTCKLCSFKSQSRKEYFQHQREAHKQVKSYKKSTEYSPKGTCTCKLCGVKIQSRKEYFQHKSDVHNIPNPYKKSKKSVGHIKVTVQSKCLKKLNAENCSRNQKNSLANNIQTTSVCHSLATTVFDTEKTKCKFCDHTFDSSNDLFDHIDNIHSQAHVDLNEVQKNIYLKHNSPEKNALHKYTERGSMLYCNFCLKSYSSVAPMLKHIKSVHLPHVPYPAKAKIKNHLCKLCKKKFESNHMLVLHQKTHVSTALVGKQDTPVECSECKEYFNLNELANHIKLHKFMKKPSAETSKDVKSVPNIKGNVVKILSYVCEYCSKCLLSKQAMEYHIQRSHLDQ